MSEAYELMRLRCSREDFRRGGKWNQENSQSS